MRGYYFHGIRLSDRGTIRSGLTFMLGKAKFPSYTYVYIYICNMYIYICIIYIYIRYIYIRYIYIYYIYIYTYYNMYIWLDLAVNSHSCFTSCNGQAVNIIANKGPCDWPPRSGSGARFKLQWKTVPVGLTKQWTNGITFFGGMGLDPENHHWLSPTIQS